MNHGNQLIRQKRQNNNHKVETSPNQTVNLQKETTQIQTEHQNGHKILEMY